MGYTLREAAEATGKEPSTIQRAIKKGKLSAPLGESGSYDIDPAELHRVYPPVASNDTQPKRQHQGNRAQLESENRVLQAKVEMLSEVVGDLRGRLDKAEQERRETLTKLTALLTDQRPQPMTAPLPPRRAWPVLVALLALAGGVAVGLYLMSQYGLLPLR